MRLHEAPNRATARKEAPQTELSCTPIPPTQFVGYILSYPSYIISVRLLVSAYAVIALAAIMAGLFDASKIPMSKIPHLVWGAIAAYIASAALNEADPGVYTEPLSE